MCVRVSRRLPVGVGRSEAKLPGGRRAHNALSGGKWPQAALSCQR